MHRVSGLQVGGGETNGPTGYRKVPLSGFDPQANRMVMLRDWDRGGFKILLSKGRRNAKPRCFAGSGNQY